MSRSLSQQFADHERMDAGRFDSLGDSIKALADEVRALRQDFNEHRAEMKPVSEAWMTVKNGRNGLLWITITITAIGGAVMAIKGMFR